MPRGQSAGEDARLNIGGNSETLCHSSALEKGLAAAE
jgi:hypothetical protein